MFLCMVERLIGFVVVNRSIVLVVMVVNAVLVVKLVADRCRPDSSRQASLHGEAIQGQAQQQQDVDDSTQEGSPNDFRQIIAACPRFPDCRSTGQAVTAATVL